MCESSLLNALETKCSANLGKSTNYCALDEEEFERLKARCFPYDNNLRVRLKLADPPIPGGKICNVYEGFKYGEDPAWEYANAIHKLKCLTKLKRKLQDKSNFALRNYINCSLELILADPTREILLAVPMISAGNYVFPARTITSQTEFATQLFDKNASLLDRWFKRCKPLAWQTWKEENRDRLIDLNQLRSSSFKPKEKEVGRKSVNYLPPFLMKCCS